MNRTLRGLLLPLLTLTFAYGVGPAPTIAQTAPVVPRTLAKLTPCTPLAQLHGRDTLLALLPCNRIETLVPAFRPVVECTLAKMKAGGWDAVVFEAYRSDTRQGFLYRYGRTLPGPKVTNARTARTSAHGTGHAVDIIHRKRGWNHPRFFHWLAIHADACQAEAGAYWRRFPDRPHVQNRAWRKS